MKLYESNLGGGQFICREICCFVHWARKNILQPKERWQEPFAEAKPYFFFLYFDFALMNVYMNTGIK